MTSWAARVLVVGEHERASLPPSRPVAPFALCLILMSLLLAVYLAAVGGVLAGTVPRPEGAYYQGSEVVGLVVTCVLFLATCVAFGRTAATDPGKVPREFPWAPEAHDPLGVTAGGGNPASGGGGVVTSARGFERKSDGRTRWCKTCNLYKPDRAHHCRRLGRCVLEMDHWCAWVRNTIGYRNKKYFLLMLTYGLATLIAYCVTLGPFLPQAIHISTALDFFIVLAFVLAGIEVVLLMVFWGFHVYLASTGFTTIEFREKRMAESNKLTKSGQRVRDLFQRSPYDHGVFKNLQTVLGPNVLLWGIPTRHGLPDGSRAGCVFEVREDHPLVQQQQESHHNKQGSSAAAGGGDDDESASLLVRRRPPPSTNAPAPATAAAAEPDQAAGGPVNSVPSVGETDNELDKA